MLIKPSQKELVSVILPVYNAERYIAAAVKSVLQQTYLYFECIIINDGSTDGTDGQLKQFRNQKRVKLVERENKGLISTLNEAVSLCEGNYIMRMDADDLSLPGRMAKQLAFLQANDLEIAGSAIQTFGGMYRRTRRYFADNGAIKFQLGFASCFAHPTVFCTRETLLNNPYDSRYEKIEDYELWTRLAKKGLRMGNCSDVLLHYRIHKSQVTHTGRSYQDQERIQIAKNYSRWYLSTDEHSLALDLLLSRKFDRLNAEHIACLNRFYQHLKTNFRDHKSVVDYHFFLCLVHNFFPQDVRVDPLNELSHSRKVLVKICNQIPFLKRLPVQLYRAMA